MNLSAADIEAIRQVIREELKRSESSTRLVSTNVPRRLSVIEFGACVMLSPEVVKRRIRSRFIDRKHVEGRPGGFYRIDRAALEKFNVPLDLAAERLDAFLVAARRAAFHATS